VSHVALLSSGTAPFVVNVGVHMEHGEWVVNEGESKDEASIGSEQDGFRVPWNKVCCGVLRCVVVCCGVLR